MAIRNIREIGEEVLGKNCKMVMEMTPRTRELIEDMLDTMYEANGVGLAAPQVGVLRRACVVMDDDTEEYIELVNPEIVAQEGEEDGLEGCLSIPGMWGYVKRPTWVKVRAQDREGSWFETEGSGLAARCFCHELEHLEGHMYDEHVDRLYTSEEMDAILSEEENQGRRRRRRRR